VYLAYAKSSKFVNENTLPNLTFMGNCIVELYSLDVEASYQHAFIYVRQLALHLRAGITKKTREAFAQVYNWQYMNCLKVWVAVVASNCGTGEVSERSERALRSTERPPLHNQSNSTPQKSQFLLSQSPPPRYTHH